MNDVKVAELKITGTGIVTPGKSPLEKMVEENEGEILKTSSNNAVPSTEVILDKHDITEENIIEEQEAFVEKTTIQEEISLQLKKTNKPGFNPNKVANAMSEDSDNDGGLMVNKTAVLQEVEGESFQALGNNKDELAIKNKFEVTGFSIQYQPKGSKGIASEEVRDYYDTIEDIFKRFKDDTYLKPDGNISRISRGAPIICFNERQIREYINEEWRRS